MFRLINTLHSFVKHKIIYKHISGHVRKQGDINLDKLLMKLKINNGMILTAIAVTKVRKLSIFQTNFFNFFFEWHGKIYYL